MRKKFVETASLIIEDNINSSLILGDIGVFGFKNLKEKFPDRVFNIGILEQSMIGVAAGFSSEKIIPIVHSIAPFLIERAYEQIKIDFGYHKFAGNLVSVGASFDYSRLGATHHCPADVNLISNIPGTKIFIPGHKNEFEKLFKDNWDNESLNYFRLSEVENDLSIDVELNEIVKLKNGNLATMIVVGPYLKQALLAVGDLDIEIHYLNAFSTGFESKINSNFPGKKLIIHEPYYSGAILQQTFSQVSKGGCEILQIGVPKRFIHEYGTYDQLLVHSNLDHTALRNRITEFIHG
jgi:transketolase